LPRGGSRWSFGIGTWLGVPVRIHWTFLLLILGLGLWVGSVHGWVGAGWWVLTVLLLFGSVLLHELGHSVAALGLGYKVRDITLLPIGGIARMERTPTDPLEELMITAAGPLVNFAIALVLAVPLGLGWAQFRMVDLTTPYVVSNLLWLNLVLGLFNLLPAFPMDGGRLLRAVLALAVGRAPATRVAALLGQALAVLMMLVGVLLNWWLILIGVFVFLAARSEARAVQIEERMRGVTVGRMAIRDPAVLRGDSTLWEAEALARTTFQQDFPVVDREGRLVGILDRDALERGLRTSGPAGPVGGVAAPAQTAAPGEELEEAFRRMGSVRSGAVVVVDPEGRVVGLLPIEQIRKAVAFAWGRPGGRSPAERLPAGNGEFARSKE